MAVELKCGSLLAVLKDGRHVSATCLFIDSLSFKMWVATVMNGHRYNVRRFWYAYGTESQEYTPREVLEVYFNE